MQIVPESAAHRARLRDLLLASFPGGAEATLVDRLRADGALTMSLVAVEGREVIGHVAFSPMIAPFRALGLAPLAVAAARRRVGVGTALVTDGLARAAALGWEGAFVLGDPGYYGRFGFAAEAAAGFSSPYAGPYFILRTLASAPLPLSGPVAYAAAFTALHD